MRPGAHIYGLESSESGRVGAPGDLGENPRPVLTSITLVSKLLTYITHTHPKIKSDAILELRAH
jgi:hypothetical protein